MIFELIKLRCNVQLFSVVLFAFPGLWSSIQRVECARILALETVSAKSHWNVMSAVLNALVDKGHRVTVFTPFVDGDRTNYTEVDISEMKPPILDETLETMVQALGNQIKTVHYFTTDSRMFCTKIFENSKMKSVLDSGAHSDFDLVIIDSVYSECVTYLASKLNLPLIYVTPLPAVGLMEYAFTGHFSNPALVSNVLADYSSPKTFVHRFTNTILLLYCLFTRELIEFTLKLKESNEHDSFLPAVKPSLVFVNGHYGISNAPNPTPTEIVNVGGIHLKAPKPLPKDILEFIEQSPHGVICFTFGSMIKMAALPKHIFILFIEALGQIPQRILLKYEDEIENKPKNIMIKKWLPQRDILLHPKVKLFISHGGISGIYETVDAGVPVLGFPLFADQARNIDHLVNIEMAISMDLLSVSKEIFLKNIFELLNNEKYMKNAKTASKILNDRPNSPSELVVYWTEYVLRHKGAPHLKSHALNLVWYQYFLLDVIFFVLIFIFIIFFISRYVLKSIYKYGKKFCYIFIVKSKSE